jgi:hypothetical protein
LPENQVFSLFLLRFFTLLFAFGGGLFGGNLVVSLETSDRCEQDGVTG